MLLSVKLTCGEFFYFLFTIKKIFPRIATRGSWVDLLLPRAKALFYLVPAFNGGGSHLHTFIPIYCEVRRTQLDQQHKKNYVLLIISFIGTEEYSKPVGSCHLRRVKLVFLGYLERFLNEHPSQKQVQVPTCLR